MHSVTHLAARLDEAYLRTRGVVVADESVGFDALPECDPHDQLHGRLLIKYLTTADVERFGEAAGISHFSGMHSVTPTTIASSDLATLLGPGGPESAQFHALVLRPDRLGSVRGPRWFRDKLGIEYVVGDGFSSAAIESRVVMDRGRAEAMSGRPMEALVFTDIANSTALIAESGDAEWNALIERHDQVARSLIAEHGGHFVKSTGDGLLATFGQATPGVECGLRIITAMASLGMEVRAGVHVGEFYVRENPDAHGDLAGIAVNFANRVMSEALPGELWASSAIRDVMMGSGYQFTPQGEHDLKGVPDSAVLYSVCEVPLDGTAGRTRG